MAESGAIMSPRKRTTQITVLHAPVTPAKILNQQHFSRHP